MSEKKHEHSTKDLPGWGVIYFSSTKAVVGSVWLGGWSENKLSWENILEYDHFDSFQSSGFILPNEFALLWTRVTEGKIA